MRPLHTQKIHLIVNGHVEVVTPRIDRIGNDRRIYFGGIAAEWQITGLIDEDDDLPVEKRAMHDRGGVSIFAVVYG